jgi:branched-chain amino acid transport system permease protein
MTQALQQALATGVLLGFVYALVALGFAITFGVMRIANFAHGQFVVAGMYLMIVLHQQIGMPVIIAIPLCVLIVAAIGMGFEWLTVEPIAGYSHYMQMIVTLGGLIILQQISSLIFGTAPMGVDLTLPALNLRIGQAFISGPRVLAALVSLGAITAVLLVLRRTFFGRAVRSVADSRASAQLMGVNPLKVNLAAFGVGAGCAGLAGALIVPFIFVSPETGLGLTVKSFIVVMIAGVASMPRILLVSLSLGTIEALSGAYLSLSLTPAIVYGSLIVLLVLMMMRQHRTGNLVSLGERDIA